MSEIDHSRAKELFTEYQEGTLGQEDKALLETHLGICPPCQREWEKFQKMMSALSGLRKNEPSPPDLLPGAAEKIHRRTRGLFFRKRPGRFGVPYEVIAGVLLVLLAAIYALARAMWPEATPARLPPTPTTESTTLPNTPPPAP